MAEVRSASREAEALRPFARTRFAVYALIDPRDGLPRYIGITATPRLRLKQHRWAKAGQVGVKRVAWLVELRALGLAPQMLMLARVTGAPAACKAEIGFIATALRRGMPILNSVTRGGCAIGGYSLRDLGVEAA